jgi:antibiotic biosynthesis monooxygenase (ABM) superfamily enzyme
VHTVESLLDRKRSTAALAALGATTADLARSQRSECALLTLPLSFAGVLLGTLALGPFAGGPGSGVLLMLANLVLTPALVWVAIAAAVRLVQPWTVRAGAPGNLRTE